MKSTDFIQHCGDLKNEEPQRRENYSLDFYSTSRESGSSTQTTLSDGSIQLSFPNGDEGVRNLPLKKVRYYVCVSYGPSFDSVQIKLSVLGKEMMCTSLYGFTSEQRVEEAKKYIVWAHRLRNNMEPALDIFSEKSLKKEFNLIAFSE